MVRNDEANVCKNNNELPDGFFLIVFSSLAFVVSGLSIKYMNECSL